jgi:D-3-phosphoglycerate dehydrogenase
VNNIPVEAMTRAACRCSTRQGANANAVKELVLGAILAASRNLVPAAAYVQGLAPGADFEKRVEEGKKQFAGHELPGRTLGVIGLGAIGGLVADTAIKLGMKVLATTPTSRWRTRGAFPPQVRKAHSIEEVLRGSDFVSLHVPLVEATRNLIDRAGSRPRGAASSSSTSRARASSTRTRCCIRSRRSACAAT